MYSLGIVKPYGVAHQESIFQLIESTGLNVVYVKKVKFNQATVAEIYRAYVNEAFFDSLCKFMSSAICMVFLVNGENAVDKLNRIVGGTDPKLADKATIRALYGTDIQKNAIHSVKSVEEFYRQCILLVPEFYNWTFLRQ